MILRTLLFISLISNTLFAFDQIVVVLAETINSNHASLQRYVYDDNRYVKYGAPIEVNLGKKGLAWKKNPFIVLKNPLYKKEGDLKAPAGVFSLSTLYGYAKNVTTNLTYIQSSDSLICVDDVNSKAYNKILKVNSKLNVSSFEWMKRDDKLYKYALVVDYNSKQVPGAGSCIFLHVEKTKNSPTAGCTSMQENDLQEVVKWLDSSKKPLLIQIPKTHCLQYQGIFDGIDCS